MNTFVLATPKPWHDDLYHNLVERVPGNWVRVKDKDELTEEKLQYTQPAYIFVPHWSHIIQEEVYNKYQCIVFHMTDLPFGRGGSPLQNLIERGFEQTMISAIKVSAGLDKGPVYLKRSLSLLGTAEEIFIRSAKIIEGMIVEILEKKIVPVPQSGIPVNFKRRKPSDSDLASLATVEQVFDYIRMLDCEGYPNAFIEFGNFRLEFSRASLKSDKSIIADVRITKK